MKGIQIKNSSKVKFFAAYTLCFVITFLFAFFPFLTSKKSLVWRSDASGQYVPNLYYLYSNMICWARNLLSGADVREFPSFSFSAGVGADVINLYCKGILDYIGVIFRRVNIERTFSWIIILRMYVSGLSFGAMASHFGQKACSMVPGALVYVFTGFTMYYGLRHTSFLIPVILLPLQVLGLEKIIRRESPFVFVAVIFYAAWTDYYFLYMSTIVLGIYGLVRCLTEMRLRMAFQAFFRAAAAYILGIGLAAVAFLPRVYKLFNSSRTSVVTVESRSLLSYGLMWLPQFLARLTAPYTTSQYTKYYMLYAVSAMAVIAFAGLFAVKDKAYRRLRIWTLLGIVFFCCPIFAFIFSGFNSLVNRWSYAFTLLAAAVVTVVLPAIEKFHWRTAEVTSAYTALLAVAVFGFPDVGERATIVGLRLLVLCLFLYCLLACLAEWLKRPMIFYAGITLTVMLTAAVNGIYIYSNRYTGFVNEFVDRGGVAWQYDNSEYAGSRAIKDDSFYRVESSARAQYRANAPQIFDVAGTDSYDSTLSGDSLHYNARLQNNDQCTTTNFYGYDERSWLDALAGVGYYITNSQSYCAPPYGFTYYGEDTCKNGSVNYIYQNQYSLGIGYTYSTALGESEAEKLGALELQETMVNSVVMTDQSKIAETVPKGQIKTEGIRPLEVTWDCDEDVTFDGHRIVVSERNAKLYLTYENVDSAELYLSMRGLNVDQASETSMGLNISGDGGDKTVWTFHSLDKYRVENWGNYLINLGCSSTGQYSISFPRTGVYEVDALEIYAVDMSGYETAVTALGRERLRNVTMGRDQVSGTLELKEDKILCMSIPYSEFWKAYVDGQEIPVERANYMWMAIPVSAGNHTVQFVYQNKALILGFWITVVFATALLVSVFWRGGRRKHRARKTIRGE